MVRNYSEKTKKMYSRMITVFLSWLKEENKQLTKLNYQDFLEFIKSRKAKNQSVKFINNQLRVIGFYLDNLNVNNPTTDLKLKGSKQKIPQNLLSEKQLNQLYFNWKSSFIEREVLGFLVFQGLKMGEIKRLETKDIDFQKGTIFIKGSQKVNTRKLPLKAHQAMNLQEFLFQLKEENNPFLFPQKQFLYLSQKLNKKLKASFQTNSLSIRNSVICNWLKQFNLREVQYKSGHKYVSSTEKYQQVNVQDLQEAVMRFHPI